MQAHFDNGQSLGFDYFDNPQSLGLTTCGPAKMLNWFFLDSHDYSEYPTPAWVIKKQQKHPLSSELVTTAGLCYKVVMTEDIKEKPPISSGPETQPHDSSDWPIKHNKELEKTKKNECVALKQDVYNDCVNGKISVSEARKKTKEINKKFLAYESFFREIDMSPKTLEYQDDPHNNPGLI